MPGAANWLNHHFEVYNKDTTWNDVPGVYIFAEEIGLFTWNALYVGETNSFLNRFSHHEKWYPAIRLGMDHVHVLVNHDATTRLAIEARLILAFDPPLNRT